ncbi:MAG: hypothetical protein PF486_01135 [Prolixibacteraceae bacterium]|jgi:hypothetical protein|nr:hypothetical protein [Prolixibacteraceae bacterium]
MKQNKITPEKSTTEVKEITRKDAIKKAGKYAAVTAAAMFIVLSPKDSQAQSPAPRPGW